MLIRSIEAKYFLGFGDNVKIKFPEENGVFGVIGKYSDYDKKSNRAGKSSFLEIILYNLYGKCRAKKEIEAINWNYPGEDMITKITYNFDGRIVTIARGRTASNNSILEVTGLEDEHKKDVQTMINDLVGCNYEDFVLLNYFLQGDIHNFMNSGATEMTKHLSRWINTQYWEDNKKRTDAIVKKVELELNDLVIFNKHNDISLESIKMASESKKEVEKGILSLKDKLSNLKALEELQNNFEELNEEAEDLKRDLDGKFQKKKDKLNSKLEKYNEKLKEIKENKKKIKKLEKKIINSELSKKDLKIISSEINDLKSKIRSERREIDKIADKVDRIESGEIICPITERSCGFIKGKNQMNLVEEYGEEIDKIQNEISVTEEKISKLEKEYEIIEGVLENNSKIENEIESLETDDDEIKEEIEDIEQDLEDLEKRILKSKKRLKVVQKELDKMDEEIVLVDKRDIEDLEDEIEEEVKKVGEFSRIIKEGNSKRKQVRGNLKRIAELNKKLRQLKFISFMFSKKGIQSNQIEEAFAEVEADANHILKSKYGTDIQIEFKSQKELGTKEDVCPICNFIYPKGYRKDRCECGAKRGKKKKDELSLKIFVGDKETDFATDSGAGKTMASMAVRIALIRMLRRRAGIGCSMLFFDEIFAMLDEVNRKNTMQMILDTLIKDFGFTQIFCISHHEDVKEMMKKNILITKNNKNASVKWMVE